LLYAQVSKPKRAKLEVSSLRYIFIVTVSR